MFYSFKSSEIGAQLETVMDYIRWCVSVFQANDIYYRFKITMYDATKSPMSFFSVAGARQVHVFNRHIQLYK